MDIRNLKTIIHEEGHKIIDGLMEAEAKKSDELNRVGKDFIQDAMDFITLAAKWQEQGKTTEEMTELFEATTLDNVVHLNVCFQQLEEIAKSFGKVCDMEIAERVIPVA